MNVILLTKLNNTVITKCKVELGTGHDSVLALSITYISETRLKDTLIFSPYFPKWTSPKRFLSSKF